LRYGNRRRPWVDIKPWNPWEQFARIQSDINRTLDEFCRQLGLERESREIRFVPVVDLWETDSELVIAVQLPGVLEEDVDVYVSAESLVVRGVRMEVPRGRAVVREWRWGEFERELVLPKPVDPDTMRASLSDGVLEIRLGKTGL
jgi:HSP20 family protein